MGDGARGTARRSSASAAAGRLGAGVRGLRPAACLPPRAALRALGEGLDDGRLVGVLLLVDVHRRPLPWVLPAAALRSVAQVTDLPLELRREGRREVTAALLRAGGTGLEGSDWGQEASKDTRGGDLGSGLFAAFEFKAALSSLAFRSS